MGTLRQRVVLSYEKIEHARTSAGEEPVQDGKHDDGGCALRAEHGEHERTGDQRGRAEQVQPPDIVGQDVRDRPSEHGACVQDGYLQRQRGVNIGLGYERRELTV